MVNWETGKVHCLIDGSSVKLRCGRVMTCDYGLFAGEEDLANCKVCYKIPRNKSKIVAEEVQEIPQEEHMLMSTPEALTDLENEDVDDIFGSLDQLEKSSLTKPLVEYHLTANEHYCPKRT